MSERVREEDARNVLWFFGDRVNGWEAGSFTSKLMSALGSADSTNTSLLGVVFPGLVAAFSLAKENPNGLDILRDIASGRLSQ